MMAFVLALILLGLLILSAFFSSAEVAVISINRSRIDSLSRKGDHRAKRILKIIRKPDELFSTILIGNNIANVAIASMVSFLATSFFKGNKPLIIIVQTVLTTIFLVIFCEFLPKSFAYRNNLTIALNFSFLLTFFEKLFFPLVKFFSFFSKLIAPQETRTYLSGEELKHLLHTESEFIHDQDALQMISQIIDFSQKDLRLIMIPRTQLVKVDIEAKIDEYVALIKKYEFSYLPVYEEREDNLVGIIDVRQAATKIISGYSCEESIRSLVCRPLYVSEFMGIGQLLKEFKQSPVKVAFILDEYGGVRGMLTLSDILRAYIGGSHLPVDQIRSLKKNVYLVQGSLSVSELNGYLGLKIEEKRDYITVSGMLLFNFGRIPEEKSRLTIGTTTFVVKKVARNRIREVIVIINEQSNHG